MTLTSALYDKYNKEIRKNLQKDLGIKNPMALPKVEKVCVNVGMGSYLQKLSSKDYSFVEDNVRMITGQSPVVKKAKMAISNFKLRENQPVGIMVTLRGQKAYDFIDKMIHVVYPRVRDFRGVSRNIFDNDGNASVGFKDHTVFPEGVQPEDSRKIHGVQVTIVTSTKDPEHSEKLLESFGFPFKDKEVEVAEKAAEKPAPTPAVDPEGDAEGAEGGEEETTEVADSPNNTENAEENVEKEAAAENTEAAEETTTDPADQADNSEEKTKN